MDFAFTKKNYILLIVGILLICIGLFLMIGGGSNDPNVFSKAIFDTQRLTIAPILILLISNNFIISIIIPLLIYFFLISSFWKKKRN